MKRSQKKPLRGLLGVLVVFIGLGLLPGYSLADIPGFPPTIYTLNERGVDMRTGAFVYQNEDIGIGGDGRLSLNRQFNSEFMDYKGPFGYGTSHNFDIKISIGEYEGKDVAVVTRGFVSDILEKQSDHYYVSQKDPGVTLRTIGGTGANEERVAIYTLRDGTEYRFEKVKELHVMAWGLIACGETDCGYLASITKPNGEKLHFEYDHYTRADTGNPYGFGFRRLKRVTSTRGFELFLQYICDPSDPGICVPGGSRAVLVTRAYVYNWGQGSNCYMTGQCSPQGSPFGAGEVRYTYSLDAPTLVDYTVDNVRRSYTYDGRNRITAVNAAGHNAPSLWSIAYAGDKIARVSDGESRAWSYAFSGGTSTETDPSGATVSMVFEDKKRPVSQTDQRGNTTEYSYDDHDRLTGIVFPEGDQKRFTYDARSNVTKVETLPRPGAGGGALTETAAYPASCTDANRKICNKPTWTENAKGARTDYTYANAHGGVVTITSPADASGTRPRVTYQYAARSATGYDGDTKSVSPLPPIYRVIKKTETVGGGQSRVTTYEYDGGVGFWKNLNLTAVTVSAGGVSSKRQFTYDYYGNRITEDGPLSGNGDSSHYQYDAEGRVIMEVGPANASGSRSAQQYQYNADGWLLEHRLGTASIDGNGFSPLMTATFSYNGAGDLISEEGFNGNTDYSYDNTGRLQCKALRTTSAGGNACVASVSSVVSDQVFRYQYDAAGNLVAERRGVSVSGVEQEYVRYTYNTNNETTSIRDAAGNRSVYQRDGFGRLARITFPDPNQPGQTNASDYIAYTHDALGQVVTERRRDGSTVTYQYDALGRRTAKSYSSDSSFNVRYAYNHLGDVTEAYFANDTSRKVTYTYDGLGRLTATSDWIGSVNYAYDPAGNRTRMAIRGADAFDFQYDAASNLTSVRSASSELVGIDHDGLNRRREITRKNGIYTGFEYNAAGNLSFLEQGGFAEADNNVAQSFSYYRLGQLQKETLSNPAYEWPGPGASGTETFQYNGLNQQVSQDVEYDARGNVKKAAGATYLYTPDNQLASVSTGTTSKIELVYGPLGQLREINSDDQSRRFLYDGPDLIAEWDGQGALLNTYAHGEGHDNPLATCAQGRCANAQWFHADRLGSIVAVSDNAGKPVLYPYGPYGESAVLDAEDGPRFGYTGQMVLSGTGLYHYKSRAYSPELGRFLQPDTIGYGDGLNMYLYTRADPINKSDPTGKCPFCGSLTNGGFNFVNPGIDYDSILNGSDFLLRGFEPIKFASTSGWSVNGSLFGDMNLYASGMLASGSGVAGKLGIYNSASSLDFITVALGGSGSIDTNLLTVSYRGSSDISMPFNVAMGFNGKLYSGMGGRVSISYVPPSSFELAIDFGVGIGGGFNLFSIGKTFEDYSIDNQFFND